MIVIPLFILATLYLALLIWVGYKLKSWPARITVLLVMLSPFIYWVGSYQYVKYEHKAACAREGGLKVLIQPEKADRIRLDPDSFTSGGAAQDFLRMYSPRLTVVEAWDGTYRQQSITSVQTRDYFAYSIDPTATEAEKKDWKFNRFNKAPLVEPTPGLYVLSETAKIEDNVTTTTSKLVRNGQVYATWTKLHHYWTRNPGMPIGWQCFMAHSPESYGQYPQRVLTELILK